MIPEKMVEILKIKTILEEETRSTKKGKTRKQPQIKQKIKNNHRRIQAKPINYPNRNNQKAQANSIKWRINANPEAINTHKKKSQVGVRERVKDQRGPVV